MLHENSPATEQNVVGDHIEERSRIRPDQTVCPDLVRENEMLLETSIAVSGTRCKESLQSLFTGVLKRYIPFNGFAVYLLDRSKAPIFCYLAYSDSTDIVAQATSLADDMNLRSLNDGIVSEILSSQQSAAWQASDIRSRNNIHELELIEKIGKVRKLAGFPLLIGQQAIGAILLLSHDPGGFNTESLRRLNVVAPQIATAVQNAVSSEKQTRTAIDQASLISLFNRLARARTRDQFELALREGLASQQFFEDAAVFLRKNTTFPNNMLIIRQTNKKMFAIEPATQFRPEPDPIGGLWAHFDGLTEATIFDLRKLGVAVTKSSFLKRWAERRIEKIIVAPIADSRQLPGFLVFLTRDPYRHLHPYLNLIDGMASLLAALSVSAELPLQIMGKARKTNDQQQHLKLVNNYLQDEISTAHSACDIVGTSEQMQTIFDLVSQVSAADTTVLVMGETGTGKELIARAIHNNSSRKNNVMIKVNCGALPLHLVESELFGHERGSFTDATDQRIGKFELASDSTIFLDEVGELPLSAQAKLLRVLQEKEIERIGGKGPIKVNVRVIAATNSDLHRAVQNGHFRSDLYFRLNVFPINLPPLRERKEDIPALVSHFLKKHAARALTPKIRFTGKAMKQLKAYHWPGNVRELDHLIERTMLSAKSKDIDQVYLPEMIGDGPNKSPLRANVKTLDEVHREYIIGVLSMVEGKVSGVGGAAELLKMPASTLFSKMHKLKIHKDICAGRQLR